MITTIKNNSLADFENELTLICETYSDEIEKAKKVIVFLEEILKQITDWLKNHVFETIQEEIEFFKEIKPVIVSKLIFYKEVISLVATLPLDKNKKIKHYQKKINSINKFYSKNKEFIKYIKSKSNHFDEMFFTRKKYKDLFLNECSVIIHDAKICTSHDFLLAEIIAYETLVAYIENIINKRKQPKYEQPKQVTSKLNWTAKKIDLIELIYALHESKVVNNGQADIKEITKILENAFQINLGDNITRSFIDIKNRKTDQTRFLNQLQAALEIKIENDLN